MGWLRRNARADAAPAVVVDEPAEPAAAVVREMPVAVTEPVEPAAAGEPSLPGDDAISGGADAVAPVCELIEAHLSTVVEQTEDAALGFIERSSEIDGAVSSLGDRVATLVGSAERQSTSVAELGERTASMVADLTSFVADRDDAVQALIEELRGLDSFSATIRGIAQATNMLALNAMIEAARAGRDGAGFGVVAQEVQRLSHESDHAAKELGVRIEDLTERIYRALGVDQGGTGNDLERRLTAIATNQDELLATFTSTVDDVSGAVDGVRDTAGALAERSTGLASGVQFQDITRQAIEQVQRTVRRLGDHSAAIGQYARGEISPAELDARQTSMADMLGEYVMREQRVTHAAVAVGDAAPVVVTGGAPDIELF
jgi:methyl-accepting chemotaxis protein